MDSGGKDVKLQENGGVNEVKLREAQGSLRIIMKARMDRRDLVLLQLLEWLQSVQQ